MAHLHIHLIPRAAELPAERRGPDVFALLSAAGHSGRNQGDPDEARRVALAIKARLAAAS